MKRFKKGFTLAEVLITLAIIGVVAAIAIPSVISNTQQQEFKTGLRKAVSVLNSAITMNMAIDGETPYDNKDLWNYLQKHMSIVKTVEQLPWMSTYIGWDGRSYGGYQNSAFYTTDGMRFEMDDVSHGLSESNRVTLKLHESGLHACFASKNANEITGMPGWDALNPSPCGGCGSYGLKHNPNNTTKVPCALLVDVNGDRKPTPQVAEFNSKSEDCQGDNLYNPDKCSQTQKYWIPTLDSKRVSDIFVILITEDRAIPYGVVAQKAMYQAQK